jgi:cardiolipin synthase
MLDAIAGAERTITFETYIYWSGDVGRAFSDALAERARADVRVHVMLDWIGAGKMETDLLQQMIDAGVEVEKFHPLRWYSLHRLNNRTHRKLLVVDGRVGFTGVVGIADIWLGNAEGPEDWRDTHFRVEGPAVAQMQAAFMDHWIATRSVVLHGDDYLPPLVRELIASPRPLPTLSARVRERDEVTSPRFDETDLRFVVPGKTPQARWLRQLTALRDMNVGR